MWNLEKSNHGFLDLLLFMTAVQEVSQLICQGNVYSYSNVKHVDDVIKSLLLKGLLIALLKPEAKLLCHCILHTHVRTFYLFSGGIRNKTLLLSATS